jgi:hypothetical protein
VGKDSGERGRETKSARATNAVGDLATLTGLAANEGRVGGRARRREGGREEGREGGREGRGRVCERKRVPRRRMSTTGRLYCCCILNIPRWILLRVGGAGLRLPSKERAMESLSCSTALSTAS